MRRSRRVPLRTASAHTNADKRAAGAQRGGSHLPGAALGWGALGLLVVAFAATLTFISPGFRTIYEMAERPVLALVGCLVLAGIIFALCLPPIIRATASTNAPSLRIVTVWIVAAGLAARLLLFPSVPMLEDDYQRYLWDGAVTASGANPYSHSPKAARQLDETTHLGQLATESGDVISRINHPHLRTLYPPVAQGAFAVAHVVAPWSLTAWRSIVLVLDLATLALLLLLLRETGRSPLWSALYWWNPVVLKELFNSAHMDAVVLPFVLLGLLLAVRGRQIGAGASLAFAAGTKIWPALLLPIILRPLAPETRKLAIALLLSCGLVALFAMPIVLGGLDDSSGFAAYLATWQTNSALFPALEHASGALLGWLSLQDIPPGLAARAAIALALAALTVWLSVKPIRNADDLVGRASLLVAALVLLSPAQFPWYGVWFAPFLALRPWIGFLALTATIPLYYLFFYLAAHGQACLFDDVVVWIIWVPVWVLLIFEALRYRTDTRSA